MTLDALIAKGKSVTDHHPWPRVIVDETVWRDSVGALAAGELSLFGLWGDKNTVHMAVLAENALAVLSLACPHGAFPSVGRSHAPAIRLERTVQLDGLFNDGHGCL